MAQAPEHNIQLFSPGSLAQLIGVTPQCIREWERKGKIPKASRTLGGHRRFHLTHQQISDLTGGASVTGSSNAQP